MARGGHGSSSSGGVSGPDREVLRKRLDPSSPYYIPSNDYAGTNICGVLLTGPLNYREWAYAMEEILQAKCKFGFLDGSITKPSSKEDLEYWRSINALLLTWLRNSVDPSEWSSLGCPSSAKEL